MEMFEQTTGGTAAACCGAGTTLISTTTLPHSVHHHHASNRDICGMDSLYFAAAQHSNTSEPPEYELSNVTCVTMTPNGKYALIGQSCGTPQIWDTISGQLIRSFGGVCSNSTNLMLACNGALLVGLSKDQKTGENATQLLQIWEVQSGNPILMSHQIRCCVFAISADTSTIFMAGNQCQGRGISVGILDLESNELTKEIKSDPAISFGDMPASVLITPDERYAIVGCRSPAGANFVVFDITKSTEIAHTRSISLDAEPLCAALLSNTEVLTGTRGGHLIQWNIHSCKPSAFFVDMVDEQAHRACVNQIALSTSKEFVVSASSDGTAKVWNTSDKSLVCILNGHRGEVCIRKHHFQVQISNQDDVSILFRLLAFLR